MPITVFEAETILAEREGALLTLVGKDPTVTDGTPSVVYRDALREGLNSLNLLPASFSAITDADLSQVPDDKVAQLIDVADLRLMGGINANFTDVDEKISYGEIKVSQNRAAISARTLDFARYCRETYGYGLGKLGTGSLNLGTKACPYPWGDF